MGLCLSTEERAERAQSQRIDRAIEEDSKKLKRECKLLLLGKWCATHAALHCVACTREGFPLAHEAPAIFFFVFLLRVSLGSGESGKSTIVKQMKIIHQSGYTRDELYSWRATVYRNLMESAQILVLAVQRFDYHYDNSANEARAPSPLLLLCNFPTNMEYRLLPFLL